MTLHAAPLGMGLGMVDVIVSSSTRIGEAWRACKAAEVINAGLVVELKRALQTLRPPLVPVFLLSLRFRTVFPKAQKAGQ